MYGDAGRDHLESYYWRTDLCAAQETPPNLKSLIDMCPLSSQLFIICLLLPVLFWIKDKELTC